VIDLSAETARLLDFAQGARVEGGFAWLDADGRPDPAQPLQLWITARMTHVFALGHLLGRPGAAALADHGLAALRGTFADPEHGGWYAQVPGDGAKRAYEHAFVLLAASSARVAGRPGARTLFDQAAAVIDERFWDGAAGACRESYDRSWSVSEPYRGANANMHMVEAFLAAGDASGDARWHARAGRIAERLIDGTARAHDWRLPEHFDAQWRPLPGYNADEPSHPFRPFGVTPGHGLEWARLLLHLDAARPVAWAREAAAELFARAVGDGWEDGFAYTTDFAGVSVVRDRFHWVLAEGIGAAAALGEAEWEARWWAWAERHLIDRERGSWRHELDEHNRPAARTWQGKPDVYHALQATLIPRAPRAPGRARAIEEGRLRAS
jgi:mannose/cellobiose epimerase-like protein (N-acyl-D-glucosamine 2-epimerase family)